MYTTTVNTPLGPVTLAADDSGLRGLWFIGQKYYPAGTTGWEPRPDLPVFLQVERWLMAYFAGDNPPISFPLAPVGSGFRQQVWQLLLTIPHSQTTTYGELSKRMAELRGLTSMSAQAVGGAVGHNPISIIIPCHRVLGTDKSLTGFAGGLERKQALLTLEGVDTASPHLTDFNSARPNYILKQGD